MPKKKNRKFKANKLTSSPVNLSASKTPDQPINPSISQVTSQPADQSTAKTDEITLLNEKYAFVRRDVKKLLITIAILAIILVGFYFLSSKTNVLTSIGNWIYEITNIQIQ